MTQHRKTLKILFASDWPAPDDAGLVRLGPARIRRVCDRRGPGWIYGGFGLILPKASQLTAGGAGRDPESANTIPQGTPNLQTRVVGDPGSVFYFRADPQSVFLLGQGTPNLQI